MESFQRPTPDQIVVEEVQEEWIDGNSDLDRITERDAGRDSSNLIGIPEPRQRIIRRRTIRRLRMEAEPIATGESAGEVKAEQGLIRIAYQPNAELDARVGYRSARGSWDDQQEHESTSIGFPRFYFLMMCVFATLLWLDRDSQPDIDFSGVRVILEAPKSDDSDHLLMQLQSAIRFQRYGRVKQARQVYGRILYELQRDRYACTDEQRDHVVDFVRSRLDEVEFAVRWSSA